MAQHPLDQLIQRLARLPGLGPRSARRTALYLLKNRDQIMLPWQVRWIMRPARCGPVLNVAIWI